MFFPGSRYENVPDSVYTDRAGRRIGYKLMRRIAPAAEIRQVHIVGSEERFDLVAFRYYQDPLQFWRICDANRGMLPRDLLAAPGRRLLVPGPS